MSRAAEYEKKIRELSGDIADLHEGINWIKEHLSDDKFIADAVSKKAGMFLMESVGSAARAEELVKVVVVAGASEEPGEVAKIVRAELQKLLEEFNRDLNSEQSELGKTKGYLASAHQSSVTAAVSSSVSAAQPDTDADVNLLVSNMKKTYLENKGDPGKADKIFGKDGGLFKNLEIIKSTLESRRTTLLFFKGASDATLNAHQQDLDKLIDRQKTVKAISR